LQDEWVSGLFYGNGMKTIQVDGQDVLLDDWDWLRLCHIKWRFLCPSKGVFYVVCKRQVYVPGEGKVRKTIYLHRAVMCPPYGFDLPTDMEVHHIDSNPKNNRKENLEILKRDLHGELTRLINQ